MCCFLKKGTKSSIYLLVLPKTHTHTLEGDTIKLTCGSQKVKGKQTENRGKVRLINAPFYIVLSFEPHDSVTYSNNFNPILMGNTHLNPGKVKLQVYKGLIRRGT